MSDDAPGPQADAPAISADTTPARDNARAIVRFFEDVLAGGDPERARSFLHAEFADEDETAGMPPGADGVVAKLAALWASFPDGHFVPEEIVAAGDRVVARSRFVGTQTGPFGSLAPTGRTVRVRFFDVYVVRDGLIAGHRHLFDEAAMTRQLAG